MPVALIHLQNEVQRNLRLHPRAPPNKIWLTAHTTVIAARNFSMPTPRHISPDDIRKDFSRAMSDMYREEVPLYGALLELVAQTVTPRSLAPPIKGSNHD